MLALQLLYFVVIKTRFSYCYHGLMVSKSVNMFRNRNKKTSVTRIRLLYINLYARPTLNNQQHYFNTKNLVPSYY